MNKVYKYLFCGVISLLVLPMIVFAEPTTPTSDNISNSNSVVNDTKKENKEDNTIYYLCGGLSFILILSLAIVSKTNKKS